MAYELLDQVGAEGYTDNADLVARTNFVTSGTINVTTQSILNITNEKWFDPNTFANIQRNFTASGLPIINGTQKEFEFSFAFYLETKGSPSPTNQIALLKCSGVGVEVQWETNPANTIVEAMKLDFDYGSGGDTDEDVDTGLLALDGNLYYITLRIRSESAVGASDGRIEVYINGDQIAVRSGVNWSFTATTATFDTGAVTANLYNWNTGGPLWRNLTIHNGWTTADDVAPAYKHVYDAYPESGTFTDYTNEGGATDFVEAVSDGLTGTYVRSDVASAQIEYVINPPIELAGATVIDSKISIQASRESADLNSIDLELANSAGTQLGTSNTVLSAVDPTRQIIDLVVSPVATSADDLKIRITNGS